MFSPVAVLEINTRTKKPEFPTPFLLNRAVLPPEWKKELQQWAEVEERSVSWLVAKLVDKALQERRQNQQTPSEVMNVG